MQGISSVKLELLPILPRICYVNVFSEPKGKIQINCTCEQGAA
jgi:hypothetical protein